VEWELWPRDLAIPVLGCNQMNIQTWSSLLKVNFIRSLFQWIFYSTLWLRPPCKFNVCWYFRWLCANVILALQDFTAAILIQWKTRIRRIIARRNYFLAMTVTVALQKHALLLAHHLIINSSAIVFVSVHNFSCCTFISGTTSHALLYDPFTSNIWLFCTVKSLPRIGNQDLGTNLNCMYQFTCPKCEKPKLMGAFAWSFAYCLGQENCT
jgi:hypothetical protein